MPESTPAAPNDNTDKPRFLISDLCALLEQYLEPTQIREVYRSYLYGAEAHNGQHRKSGEPYIYHPIAVAKILAEMRMDHQTLVSAILHDVIEDTPTVKSQLSDEFTPEVAELVDGVSKLTHLDRKSHSEAQSENFQKMFLAMSKDIRVIIIKLADRLHNMRTLGVMPAHKRKRIANETLEIYAPIANRLGMNNIRKELEGLGFSAKHPMRANVLRNAVQKARGHHSEITSHIEQSIKRALFQEDIPADILGREKHLYSIYQKMLKKHLPFSEVFDVYGFRIIVDKVDTCYRVLGAMHGLFKPVPGKFKDYIAIPKSNGYQSLHTILFGPHGIPIEIQIRTEEMHQIAESGIASHWMYKQNNDAPPQLQNHQWLLNLLEIQKQSGNPLEFLESVKIDLFPDESYVFTPRGKIIKLAKGATAIDFAYAVHTDIGNSAIAVRVNRRLSPLQTTLYTGQTVEIITKKGAQPNPSWLTHTATAKARTSIRAYLKNIRKTESVDLGKRLLTKELEQLNSSLEELPAQHLEAVLASYQLTSIDQLLSEIGFGNRMPMLVASQLISPEDIGGDSALPHSGAPLTITGTEGMVLHLAKCCFPIPGDPIVAFFSPGKGINVHHDQCNNYLNRKDPTDWTAVQWEKDLEGEYAAGLRIEVANQRGVLGTVSSVIAQQGCNIESVQMDELDGLTSVVHFVVTVQNRKHLANLFRRVRLLKFVLKISRTKH
ncbi:MAG: bifunctional (p)ppGpp synthetase/guanosine-3',5'-bis(diphosphate) 3'-pyrophosphohydrolase [Methylococcales bacterium]|jgi:GTP diphosphokinase / guanosine-3',5'-bis(diphosphate) 3'-diphosphatase|nr:bifunctional (p)ppGpp synthetase/guanosine-3',5'-bis(diphosphate) 3'-pyrophosphohydrolase [Methylococcales bacterium]